MRCRQPRSRRGPPKLRKELAKHDHTTHDAFAKGPGRWQVSWYAGGDEIGQVIVDERTRRPIEVWTGPQAAGRWPAGCPARSGARSTRPRSGSDDGPLLPSFLRLATTFPPAHLDLLVLLSFSLSHVFFNRGRHRHVRSARVSAARLPARANADGRLPPPTRATSAAPPAGAVTWLASR